MRPLVGSIRTYAWGSRTALAALQGRPVPSPEPEAELWFGAHPSAPSHVGGVALPDIIAADPVAVLGESVVDRFGPRLPYLLKVLAAAQPLSLQAHPDAEQARAGFAAEQSGPFTRSRNYVDPYRKPEVLVAIEEFDALCGFRAPARSAALLRTFEVAALDPVITALSGTADQGEALRSAVELILHWPTGERASLVTDVAESGRKRAHAGEPVFGLAAQLAEVYPGDAGVVLALLLNRVTLRPGDAVFMPAGNLHAYLRGVGVEIMAASDNVLRGGLTPKHVDPDELARVLRFEVLVEPVIRPVELTPGIVTWAVPVDEFSLVRAVVSERTPARAHVLAGTGPRILICLTGSARCRAGAAELVMVPGDAAFLDAGEPAVELVAASDEPAVLFQAAPGRWSSG